MTYTPLTLYTAPLNAALKMVGGPIPGMLQRLRGRYAFPYHAQSGVVTLPIISKPTASTTITDGTLLTNAINNTTASFTLSENVVPYSVPPTQALGALMSGAGLESIMLSMADSLMDKAMDTYVTALISGSPTNTNALATGKTNFASATTAELSKLTLSMVQTAANRGGTLVGLNVIMHPTAFSNVMTYGANLVNQGALLGMPQWTGEGAASIASVPVIAYGTSSSSFWGAASNPCAFIIHPDGAPLVMSDTPMIHSDTGGFTKVADGTTKLIAMLPFAYSVAQVALLGEVTNPAS